MTTKNIIGMNKTFRHRTNTSQGKSSNLAWMLQDHSLDRLKWLRFSRKDWAGYLKRQPEHRDYIINKYREVIRMWI